MSTLGERLLPALGFAIQGMLIARLLRKPEAYEDFRTYLGWAAGNALRWFDFTGRVEVARDAAREIPAMVSVPVEAPESIIAAPKPPIAAPELPGFKLPSRPPVFQDAVIDIIQRAPRVIHDPLLRTGAEVGRLYTQERAFAVVRSAEEAVTNRAQSLIAESVREGWSVDELTANLQKGVREVAQRTKPWTRAYAETVARTNLNTAYNAGHIAQARKPWVRNVLPAMVFDAVKDSRTRPNHMACNGMVAPVDHEYIEAFRPPLGYNCRCKWSAVGWDWLRRRGLVNEDGTIRIIEPKAGAGPDVGFVHAGAA